MYNPATKSKLKPGQTINEYAYDYEVKQGKNIADAAATVEGLDRLIVSALCDATKWSKGKYTVRYSNLPLNFPQISNENWHEVLPASPRFVEEKNS